MRCVAAKGGKKSPIRDDQLHSWKLLEEFRTVLEKVAPSPRRSGRKGGPKRLLSEQDYLCAFLFAQFNPVIESMRGLCACSELKRVQEEVCSRPLSLGSFSEAQAVFGFERLEKVFEYLVKKKIESSACVRDKAPPALHLVDSSVFRALPRMCWAQWRHQGKTQRAVRIHLKFNLLTGQPSEALVTEARHCERKALGAMVKPGEFYVGDRYYGRDYKWLQALDEGGCGYIIRLCENANLTVIEELALTAKDKAAGVVSDQIVRLGARERWHHGPVRVVRIEKPGLDEAVILVTNQLDPKCLEAELVAEIYHQRWAIELFFRWLKCVFGKAQQWHWFAESPEGVAIQLYTSLIASLLLARRIGKLPNKRCMEMIRFHAMGMVSSEELERIIQRHVPKKSS